MVALNRRPQNQKDAQDRRHRGKNRASLAERGSWEARVDVDEIHGVPVIRGSALP